MTVQGHVVIQLCCIMLHTCSHWPSTTQPYMQLALSTA